MKFERTDNDKYTVIKFLEAKLDFQASKELKSHFNECKKRYMHRVILDLSSCSWLSSEGVGLVLYMWQYYRNDGKLFYVIKDNEVIQLLKDCGAYAAMQQSIYENLETAEYQILQRYPTGYFAQQDRLGKCPHCKSGKVELYDRGLKGLVRSLKGKGKRHVCKDCYLVWR